MISIPENELMYQHSKSQGSGGQNVNKVNTRVELRFHIGNSISLTEQQKEKIRMKLKNRISQSDELIMSSQASRSQLKNKETVTLRFHELLNSALAETKPRRPTRPGKTSVEKRLKTKKILSEKKSFRKKLGL